MAPSSFSLSRRKSIMCLTAALSAALLLGSATPASAADDTFDCKFQAGGQSFDITALRGPFQHTTTSENPPSTSKSTYALSICEPLARNADVPDFDQCPEGTRACLTIVNSKKDEPDRVTTVVPIAGGVGNLDPTIVYQVKDSKNPLARVSIALQGGMYLERTRMADLTFYCDPSQDTTEPTSWSYVRTATEGVLSVGWKTKHACPLEGPPGSPPAGSSPSTGRGFGHFLSNVFWFAFFLFVVYFLVGAYYQYSQFGSRGWDLVPHRAFWADLPFILQDLFRGTGRNSAGYASL